MTDTRSPSGRPVVDVIEEGLELYSSDGEKIGHIDEINPEFFIVSSGLFDKKQMYLPRSTEERTDGNRVYLNLSRDDIEAHDWSDGANSQLAQESSEYEGPRPGHDATSAQASQGTRIRRYEEELAPEKRVQEREVRIGKEVVEEEQTINVPVQREELRISTRPVDGAADDSGEAFDQDEVRIPVREEQVEVTKRPRAVEEVEVEKVTQEETQQVGGTVRKERFTGTQDVER